MNICECEIIIRQLVISASLGVMLFYGSLMMMYLHKIIILPPYDWITFQLWKVRFDKEMNKVAVHDRELPCLDGVIGVKPDTH